MIVTRASAVEVLSLRHSVLRPHQKLEDCIYPHDEAFDSLHAKIVVEGDIVAVGSILHESEEEEYGRGVWRIRGMAVREDFRGKGLGTSILRMLVVHARKKNGKRIWCNARVAAAALYLKEGFSQKGEPYELPGIGPHYFLQLNL